MKKSVLVSALFVFVIGCDSPYVAPQVEHTYTTSTQAPHVLTGLEIGFTFDPLSGLAYVVDPAISVFIDGRLVLKTKQYSSRSFVQLPPGEHSIRVYRGDALVGSNEQVFSFTLEAGQKGKFTIDVEYWELYHGRRERGETYPSHWKLPWSFENVDSWRRQ